MITTTAMAMGIAANHEKPAKSAPKSAIRPNRPAPISQAFRSCISRTRTGEHDVMQRRTKVSMASKLTLIDTKPGSPPRPLLRHGQALWNRITRDYDVTDAAGIELL